MSAEQKCRYRHPLQFISFVYMCGTGGRVKGQAIYDSFPKRLLALLGARLQKHFSPVMNFTSFCGRQRLAATFLGRVW